MAGREEIITAVVQYVKKNRVGRRNIWPVAFRGLKNMGVRGVSDRWEIAHKVCEIIWREDADTGHLRALRSQGEKFD